MIKERESLCNGVSRWLISIEKNTLHDVNRSVSRVIKLLNCYSMTGYEPEFMTSTLCLGSFPLLSLPLLSLGPKTLHDVRRFE